MSNVVYEYTLDHAIADGELVELFSSRWPELTGGKPLLATSHIYSEFSLASLQEIWNEFAKWKKGSRTNPKRRGSLIFYHDEW